MTDDAARIRFRDVQRRFDRAAPGFDEADFVHRKACEDLIERLSPLVIKPVTILDLGSASGKGSRTLAKKYHKSRVVSLDASLAMLRMSQGRRSMFSRVREIQADATRIPLQTGSVDIVFANLLLPWINDLPACLKEVARVLTQQGVFAFSTLGADSLREFRDAWNSLDQYRHVNEFADMHDVGDALIRAGLADPVLDVDLLTITFQDAAALFRDLTACGARNSLAGRRASLTGKMRFRRAQSRLFPEGSDRPLSVKLELVYGHAWSRGPVQAPGEVHLEPASIGRRRRT